jgi:Zn-dependent M32 family carboxypeptidase
MNHLWDASVIVAVKARVASGNSGACLVGREHRLSTEALAEELESVSRRTLKREMAPQSSNVIDELKRELRMIGK